MRMNFLDQYQDVSHGGTTGHAGNSGFPFLKINSSKFQLDLETIFGLTTTKSSLIYIFIILMSKPKQQLCYPARYYIILFLACFFSLHLFRPSVKEDSPKRHEETHAASVETPRVMEMDESRRKKLREVELKVAEYAQKLEAKGASDIALQCDIYRAKLMEVS